MGALRVYQYTFSITSRTFLPRMRNVSDNHCRENQNTHFMFNNCFSKIISFMRYCGKNCRAGQATDDTLNSGYPKTTNTHSEYIILIPFPQPQWLQERASMLRCTYIACLFSTYVWEF